MLSERYPDTNTNVRAVVKPIRELFVQIPEKNFWLALVAVVPIFFIACFNVANLILSRGTFRQKEYALRIVFGATRFRVIRQLLAESMGLALSGGIAAILISMWAVDFMVPSFFYFIPAFFSFNMSGNVLAVAVLCIIAAGLLIGLLASFQIPMKGYHEILKEGGGNIPYDARKVPIRNLLVAAEIALAFILMIGAGMNVKNYSNIKRVHPGFDCINILTMQLTLPESKYQTDQQINDFYQLVIQRIEMIDGVISTGINQQIPLRSRLGWEVEYSLENQAASEQRLNPHANYQVVSPDYFKTLGIPLKSGRFFLYGDSKYAEDVAIISQSLADYLWPTEEILGKKLKLGDPDSRETWLTIVGIVGNIRHRGLDRDVTYDLYVSCFQHPVETFTIVTRVKDDTSGYIDAIKEAIADVDRHLSVYNVLSMKEVLSNTLDEPRAFTVLAFTFAALALILATIGVYGTLSYSVSQRSHPIGIKIALGAQKSHILRDIIKKFSRLLLTGLLGGILGAILSSYLKTDLLVGETSFDPSVYIFSSIILIATLASAAYLPAIRALQINPVEVLRYE
ncbi:ABC transporter permease, partial [bacterium]|nr:ABC transporter permease [candidate division CSSED10-310 bacterium]